MLHKPWQEKQPLQKNKLGRERKNSEYYKLVYRDFREKHKDLHIDWVNLESKYLTYDDIVESVYGEAFQYKHLTNDKSKQGIKNIFSKNLSENIRDTTWLISVGRLPVRAIVKWSCFVTIKECPIQNCDADETIKHLLITCPRSAEIWSKMKTIGLNIETTKKYIFYGIFEQTQPILHELY